MKFAQRSKPSAQIPMCSIADIVFLLIIFFICVTVFREYQGLRVEMPIAKATKKIEGRRSVSYIWINRENKINIDDVMVNMPDVAPVIRAKLDANPAIIVSVRADRLVKYRYVAGVMEELKKANALRINFGTLMGSKSGGS